jgi:hypothetical protein
MTDSDITHGRWGQALAESALMWRDYADRASPDLGLMNLRSGEIGHISHVPTVGGHVGNVLRKLGGPRPPESELISLHRQLTYFFGQRDVDDLITVYLVYVNANLILSNAMDSALHDWEDILPFYRQKFLGVAQRNPPGAAQADASRQLFDIALPELAIDSPRHLLRVLKHRHVEELRRLIDAASKGDVEFDADFARNVFREVFGIERKAAKGRRIVGYATMPIGFIPLIGNFVQALVQEAAGTLLERRLRKPYRWLYMLSDLAQQPTTQALPKRP